jgi:hypothetical protein
MFAAAGSVTEFYWQQVAFDESLDDNVWCDENAKPRSG